ncbi:MULTISPECIES: hypothetical protein [Bacteria]|uniref:hypothetical protein n=1 Tax=Bacteria TaxID=2 RepID=UPI003C7ED0E5
MASAEGNQDRVRPGLSLGASAVWAVIGLALVPVAMPAAVAINTPGAFERGDPAMLLPLLPVVCAIESGFHLRRFFADRSVWHLLEPKPLRSPLWWLIPSPRPSRPSR